MQPQRKPATRSPSLSFVTFPHPTIITFLHFFSLKPQYYLPPFAHPTITPSVRTPHYHLPCSSPHHHHRLSFSLHPSPNHYLPISPLPSLTFPSFPHATITYTHPFCSFTHPHSRSPPVPSLTHSPPPPTNPVRSDIKARPVYSDNI